MAHFAELDSNDIVQRVIVVHNNELLVNGVESQDKGLEFVTNWSGHSNWVQTSFNSNFRGRCAAQGMRYDSIADVFVVVPKCHDEAVLDEATCRWTCENVEHLTEIVPASE